MDYSSKVREIDISSAFVGDDQVNDGFSVIFETNGTHVKCIYDKDWAQHWWDITNYDTVPCGSSTTAITIIHWGRETIER